MSEPLEGGYRTFPNQLRPSTHVRGYRQCHGRCEGQCRCRSSCEISLHHVLGASLNVPRNVPAPAITGGAPWRASPSFDRPAGTHYSLLVSRAVLSSLVAPPARECVERREINVAALLVAPRSETRQLAPGHAYRQLLRSRDEIRTQTLAVAREFDGTPRLGHFLEHHPQF